MLNFTRRAATGRPQAQIRRIRKATAPAPRDTATRQIPHPTSAEGPEGSTAEAACILSPDVAVGAGEAALAADIVVADWGVPLGVADGVPAVASGAASAAGPSAAGAWTGAGACWLPEAWPETGCGAAGTGCGAKVPGATGEAEARCCGVSDGAGAVDVGGGVLRVGAVLPDVGVGDGDGDVDPSRSPITPSMPTEIEAVGASGLGVGVAAWVAGTPAVRASTAPSAATAVPRRSPPW